MTAPALKDQPKPPKDDPANNRDPLNQEAARWLKVAGVKPDPQRPHLFQLAMWGLDHATDKYPSPGDRDILRQQVEGLLAYHDPKKALAYFLNSPENPDGPLLEVRDLQGTMSPHRAAAKVLEVLDLRLKDDPRMKGTYPPVYPKSPG